MHVRLLAPLFRSPIAPRIALPVGIVWLACLLAVSKAHAGPAPAFIEAEEAAPYTSLVKPVPEASNEKAILWLQASGELGFASPKPLPKGPYWIRVRMALEKAGEAALLNLRAGEVSKTWVGVTPFTWHRIAAESDGRTALAVKLEPLSVSGVLVDRIEFEPASADSPLPPPATPPSGFKIALIASPTEKAKALAEEVRSQLKGMNIEAAAGLADASAPARPGEGYIVCCDEWTDSVAERWLPAWSTQAEDNAPFAMKPQGVFGDWPAIGAREGGTILLLQPLQWLAGKAEADPNAASAFEATPSNIEELVGAALGRLARRDAAGLMESLAGGDAPTARVSADVLLQWVDSIDTLGPLPEEFASSFVPALANWLYHAREWNLTQAQRARYGRLFMALTQRAQELLEVHAPKPNETLAPVQVRMASALYWAGRGLTAWKEAGAWQQRGGPILEQAPGQGHAEYLRGRISLASDAWAYFSQKGDPGPVTAPMLYRAESLIGGAGVASTFGDEPLAMAPKDLGDGLALPPALRRALQAPPATFEARRLDIKSASFLQQLAPGSFDKIVFRDPKGGLVSLDGLSHGPGGYDDAGAALCFAANGRRWISGPGPGAPESRRQNMPTLALNGARLDFSDSASLEKLKAGKSTALAVVSLGPQWRRGIFYWQGRQSLAALDEVSVPQSGMADINVRWRLLGKSEPRQSKPASPGPIRISQGDMALDVWSFAEGGLSWAAESDPPSAGESAWILQCRWLGPLEAPGKIHFRSAFVPMGSAPAAGLKASALRLGQGEAAFLGDATGGGMTFKGAAACFSPDEILLVGATLLDLGGAVLSFDAPVDLTIRAGESTWDVSAASRPTLRLRIPGAKIEGAQAEGDVLAVSLAPGSQTLKISPPEAIKTVFHLAAKAIEGFDAGSPQEPALKETTQPAGGQSLKEIRSDRTGGTLDFARDPDGVLYATREGIVGRIENGGAKPLTPNPIGKGLASPPRQARLADLNLDGEKEIVAGCEDGSIRVYSLSGKRYQEEVKVAPGNSEAGGSRIRFMEICDLSGSGLPYVVVTSESGALTILDCFGRVAGRLSFKGDPTAMTVAHAGAQEPDTILIGDSAGGRTEIGLDAEGAPWSQGLDASPSAVASIFSGEISGDPGLDAIFGSADGTLTLFERDASGAWTKKRESRFGDDSIAAIVAAPDPERAKTPLAIASRSGFVALLKSDFSVEWARYLEGPATAIQPLPRPDGMLQWLALSSGAPGSLYRINAKGEPMSRIAAGQGPRSLAVLSPAPGQFRAIVGSDDSVRVFSVD